MEIRVTVNAAQPPRNEDVEFFTVRDLTYGSHGKPVDGKLSGGHYGPGSEKIL